MLGIFEPWISRVMWKIKNKNKNIINKKVHSHAVWLYKKDKNKQKKTKKRNKQTKQAQNKVKVNKPTNKQKNIHSTVH